MFPFGFHFGGLRLIRRLIDAAEARFHGWIRGVSMESFSESRAKILRELTVDDPDVRASYLARYSSRIEEFADGMAKAVLAWREVDAGSERDEGRAYVSALVYCAITLHIQSMKLFLSGHIVPAGNLSRQVVESIDSTGSPLLLEGPGYTRAFHRGSILPKRCRPRPSTTLRKTWA